LANVDQNIYETFDLRIARQPSESAAYMFMRIIAYGLEYAEGIELTQGVAAGSEPAIYIRDLTGDVLAWIDVGLPSAEHVHRGSKIANRSAIYTYRDMNQFTAQLMGKKIHQAAEIPIYALHRPFVEEVAQWIDRRSKLVLSLSEGVLYISVDEKSHSATVEKHHIED